MLSASWVFKKKRLPYEEDGFYFILVETAVPKDKKDKTAALLKAVEEAGSLTGQTGLRVLDYSLETKPKTSMLVAVGKEIEKKEEKAVEIKSSKRYSLEKFLKFQEKMKEK